MNLNVKSRNIEFNIRICSGLFRTGLTKKLDKCPAISDHFRVVFEYWNLYPRHPSTSNITHRQTLLHSPSPSLLELLESQNINSCKYFFYFKKYVCITNSFLQNCRLDNSQRPNNFLMELCEGFISVQQDFFRSLLYLLRQY